MSKKLKIENTASNTNKTKNENERGTTMNNMKKEPAMKEIVSTREGNYTVEIEKFTEHYVCHIRPQTSNRFEASYTGFLEKLNDICANAFEFTKICFSPCESCELARAIQKMAKTGKPQCVADLIEAIGNYEAELAEYCDDNEDDEEEDIPQEKLDELNEIIDFLYDELQDLIDDMRDFRYEMGMQEW